MVENRSKSIFFNCKLGDFNWKLALLFNRNRILKLDFELDRFCLSNLDGWKSELSTIRFVGPKIKIVIDFTKSTVWSFFFIWWKSSVNTVECRNPNMFGFQTEAFCSVCILVRTGINAKIRTICSDFGIIGILVLWMPKSERSNEPNDPKSEQVCLNDQLFGFQHCLDFGC